MYPIIIENSRKDLIVYTRTPSGYLKKFVDTLFHPYFYVEDPSGPYKTIDGKNARKVFTNNPRRIPELKKKYENRGYKVYEADIVYTIRYAIDKYNTPWLKTPIRICYFDIEVEDSLDYINTPKPIVSITTYDNFDNKYYIFIIGKEDKVYSIKDGYLLSFKNEKDLLNKFLSFIIHKDPDLLVAWNIKYDINYLVNRMEKLGINYNKLSRLNKVIKRDNEVIKIYGRVLVDLLKLYKKLKGKTLQSYSLENVAHEEKLGVYKIPRKEINKMSMWELATYNKRDVEILVKLDSKLGIIQFWDELRRFIGIAWNDFIDSDFGVVNKRIVDVYLLRLAKRNGIVLPSTQQNERKPYEGALVLQPPAGVFKNVIVLDVTSMYPNIIRTYNLSPETLDENGEITTPISYRFKKKPIGLIAQACSELFELRKQYKKTRNKYLEEGNEEKYKEFDAKQRAVKIVLNSLYGVMAYKNFRLFKQEVAETVTAFGRELIKHIIRVVEKEGHKVIYGDTDSVFIKLPDNWSKEKCYKEAQRLVNVVNDSFDEFSKQFGVDKHYHKIELKFVFDRIAFFGVKKRYAGYYVNEEGEWKEGFEIKGLQIVRSDTAEITREVLNNVLTMLLRENKTPFEVLRYLNEVKQKIKKNNIPIEKLVWKVSFDPNKEYKQKNAPFLRGLRLAKKLGIIDTLPSGKIVWIYVKHFLGDVIALPENKIHLLSNFAIDYSKCETRWFNNIESLVKRLISRPRKLFNYSRLKNDL